MWELSGTPNKFSLQAALEDAASRAIKNGTLVKLSGQGIAVYTVQGYDILNGRAFFRLAELPGALFLRESLTEIPEDCQENQGLAGERESLRRFTIEIADRERLALKVWVDEQLSNYRSLPQYGATGQHMFLRFKGRVEMLEEIKAFLFSRDALVESKTAVL